MSSVLIVDDQATNRRVLGQLAGQLEADIQVQAFADAAAALDQVARAVPDLVITDFNMPGMDGADFIAAFRDLETCRDIPVIVVTAYEDSAYRYRALEAGATDFLLSPVDHREFITRGRNLLALRAALRQQERLAALGIAMAKIHHDLRNVLTSASLISDYLADSDDQDVRRVAPTLVRSLDRAMHLCSQTMDFLRTDSATPECEAFDFSELVDDIFGSMAVESPKASLSADIEPGLTIFADRHHIDRILTNLSRNALQAGATALEIAAVRVNGHVVIDVADDGPGLPPERKRDLFRPLGASGRKDGTGLGLAIASDLVTAHDGVIELVDSTDSGTRFRITLPAQEIAKKAVAAGR